MDTLRRNGYTVTVEGTWYEVSDGEKVIDYGNAKEGITPTQVYERLHAEGLFKVEYQDTRPLIPPSSEELTKQEKQYLLDLKKTFSQVQTLEQMQERYEWFSLASSVKKDDLVKEFMHSPEFCNAHDDTDISSTLQENALPTSPKALKEEIMKSMSEFKSQQRDYYAKWEEWRGAKEEWLDLAMDEDNFSQRAEWSIEASQKQIRAAAQQAINSGIDKAVAARFSAKAIYAALQPQLDPDGFYLLHAAEKVTGFKVDREYPVEDNLHHFEAQNGFGMMRYLEAAQFGERTFERIAPGTEVLEKYKINSDTLQFGSFYARSSYTEAIDGMKKSASLTCDLKQLVSTAANMQRFDPTGWAEKLTPQAMPKYDDGWVNISDHLKTYALPYVDEEQQYHEQYKMPASTDYRMYATFEYQPDDKVPPSPNFNFWQSEETITDKLFNVFNPGRETSRLQSELKALTDNTKGMLGFTKLLDKSIFEMNGEITAMRELSIKATQEIESGKHTDDWVQLNLKPELKALGLNPEKSTFHDLIKTLNQNAPDLQPVQEIAMEM